MDTTANFLTKTIPSDTFADNSITWVFSMASRLFIVDSSPAVHRVVEQASGSEGYDVTAFKDARSALDAAGRLMPDIIIADYHLDGMAFTSFCSELKKSDRLASTPIISLVNIADRLDEAELRTLGVKALLKKPLQADQLLQVVKRLQTGKKPRVEHPLTEFDRAQTNSATLAAQPKDSSASGRGSRPEATGSVELADDRTERLVEPESHGPESRLSPGQRKSTVPPEPVDTGKQPGADLKPAETPMESRFPIPPRKPAGIPEPGDPGREPGAELDKTVANLVAHMIDQARHRAEQTVAQILPGLLAEQVKLNLQEIVQAQLPSQITAALPREEMSKVAKIAVQRELPEIVASQITSMEPVIQERLTLSAGHLVGPLTERLVRELAEPTVVKHLPEVVKQQLGSIDKLVKDAAQEIASKFAAQSLDAIMRDVVRDTVEKSVQKLVPDLAVAEIKKEIDRLTA